MKNKDWYKSKTVWSCSAALVIAITSAVYGETNVLVAGMITAASALGIYGRTTAKTGLK